MQISFFGVKDVWDSTASIVLAVKFKMESAGHLYDTVICVWKVVLGISPRRCQRSRILKI